MLASMLQLLPLVLIFGYAVLSGNTPLGSAPTTAGVLGDVR
jgi:hypothetical protein